MCPVDATQIDRAGMEIIEQPPDVVGDSAPGSLEEAGPKTVWSRCTGPVHPIDGALDLLQLEGATSAAPSTVRAPA
jgi:hypothetical protein